MKTFELTLLTLVTFGFYGTYLYYQLTKENDPVPTNLWYGLGSGIDEFFFNSGIKPKKSIQDQPNVIAQRLGQ